MNLTPAVVSIANDDQTWLASSHGTNTGDPVPVVVDAGVAATGQVPSGTLIATDGTIKPDGTTRTVADAVTNGTTTLTSATATFVATDVGSSITGTNIPADTTIASRTNGTTIVLSQAASGSGSGGTIVIGNGSKAAGFLLTPVPTGKGAGTYQGVLIRHGQVSDTARVAKGLPALTAQQKTDLAANAEFILV